MRWYYTLDNRQRSGPVTSEELHALALRGILRPDHMVMQEAGGKWFQAAQVPGLFPVVGNTQPSVALHDRRHAQASSNLPLILALGGGGVLFLLLVSCGGILWWLTRDTGKSDHQAVATSTKPDSPSRNPDPPPTNPDVLEEVREQDTKKDAQRFDSSFMEMNWGIRHKYFKISKHDYETLQVSVTFIFTKDSTRVTDLKRAFGQEKGGPKPEWPVFYLYLYDEDNILVGKSSTWDRPMEGFVSGKTGDAFRVYVAVEQGLLERARRIEARIIEPEPPKN